MFRLLAVALTSALLVAVGPVRGSPLWSSDQIRAKRPIAETEALVFDLHRETSRPGEPKKVVEQVVTLAPTFSYIAEGDDRILDDHLLCRTLSWKEGGETLNNISCYAVVAFRLAELQNRLLLNRIMVKAGPDQVLLNVFSEAELGVAAQKSAGLQLHKTGEGAEYRLGTQTIASIGGSNGELSVEEMRRLARFLARNAQLHPQVRRELIATGRLPAVIDTRTGPFKLDQRRQVLRISNLRRATTAYPLPAGLTSKLVLEAGGASPRALALRRVSAVLGGAAPRPTAEETMAALRKAAEAGRDLDAMLLVMELTQEQAARLKAPSPLLAEMRSFVGPLAAKPDAAQLLEASNLAGDRAAKGDREAAARFLASPRWDGLPFGTFRNVTYANLVAASPGAKDWDPKIRAAMPANRVDNYWIHIAAHPWAGNAFKDAGDSYYREFDTVNAWMAFDLGRLVDPDWRDGVMGTVDAYEKRMREAQSDFF